jgi:probable HAF family extracellular repeat protein
VAHPDHAYLYMSGTITDLGSLNRATGVSAATAINDGGQILVDAASTSNGQTHTFLLSPAA